MLIHNSWNLLEFHGLSATVHFLRRAKLPSCFWCDSSLHDVMVEPSSGAEASDHEIHTINVTPTSTRVEHYSASGFGHHCTEWLQRLATQLFY